MIEAMSLSAELGAPENENMKGMDGWTCVLKYDRKQFTFPFYMGSGHSGREPQLKDVLHCLVSDSFAGQQSFEEFCGEFGYDTDSRKAEATWKACQKTYRNMVRLFGEDGIQQLNEELDRKGWN